MNNKSTDQIAKDKRDVRKEYLNRPAVMAETFLKKFGNDISHFDLPDQLKVFCEFCGSASDFSTADLIRRMNG
jgi:hypothetical protein